MNGDGVSAVMGGAALNGGLARFNAGVGAEVGGAVPISTGRGDRRLNSAGSMRSYVPGVGTGFRSDAALVNGGGAGMGGKGSEAGLSKVWHGSVSVLLLFQWKDSNLY
jgi:hypothetical protein